MGDPKGVEENRSFSCRQCGPYSHQQPQQIIGAYNIHWEQAVQHGENSVNQHHIVLAQDWSLRSSCIAVKKWYFSICNKCQRNKQYHTNDARAYKKQLDALLCLRVRGFISEISTKSSKQHCYLSVRIVYKYIFAQMLDFTLYNKRRKNFIFYSSNNRCRNLLSGAS